MNPDDSRTGISDLASPEDRIAILEDLEAFHRERILHGSLELLRILGELRCESTPDKSAEDLRAVIDNACAELSGLAHQFTIGNLVTEETRLAPARWPFPASPSRVPS
ncbi:hypothetical protein [Paraburkholderia acidiphila]|uniref:Uncharacterized protein n=1 Tax=Paraburkholderia acidiphila TaxID=2571747 RepID=A0A7Z2GB69_9BURK|nr:hypothetical protein [Paraburkholderia acidiphila]QGZ58330.1 hypothetical protein FAZ97_25365 [Paraburkholderia acidiphila]